MRYHNLSHDTFFDRYSAKYDPTIFDVHVHALEEFPRYTNDAMINFINEQSLAFHHSTVLGLNSHSFHYKPKVASGKAQESTSIRDES
jgi:hypothetical protein